METLALGIKRLTLTNEDINNAMQSQTIRSLSTFVHSHENITHYQPLLFPVLSYIKTKIKNKIPWLWKKNHLNTTFI